MQIISKRGSLFACMSFLFIGTVAFGHSSDPLGRAAIGFDFEKNESVVNIKVLRGAREAEIKGFPLGIPANSLEFKTDDCPDLQSITIGEKTFEYNELKLRQDFAGKNFSKMNVRFKEPVREDSCEVAVIATSESEELRETLQTVQWGPYPPPLGSFTLPFPQRVLVQPAFPWGPPPLYFGWYLNGIQWMYGYHYDASPWVRYW
jgi:hypothetical protein